MTQIKGFGWAFGAVGIYLREKLFIHSSERVQIKNLDPESLIRDEQNTVIKRIS